MAAKLPKCRVCIEETTSDLAGFSVGALERGQELPGLAHDGDIILGLSSNGVHSNGYSLVRKIVATAGLDWSDMAPFEDQSLSKAFLRPTKLYVKQCMSIMESKGLGHLPILPVVV